MLTHIVKYKFICLFRDKTIMFWAFMFPVILAVLFHIVLTSLNSNEDRMEVKFSVVDNAAYHQDKRFYQFINGMNQSIYNVSIHSLEEAEGLLKDQQIDGYVVLKDEINLVVKKSGAEQSLLNALFNEYVQMSSLSSGHLINKNYVDLLPLTKRDNTDFGIMIYYSLIAMSCLYASFWGLRIILLSQADLSSIGARMGLVPQKKIKILAIDFLISWFIQVIIIVFQLFFMVFVLKIELLRPLGLVLILTSVGSAMAISLGALVGALVRKNEETQVTILNAIIGIGYVLTVSQMSDVVTSEIPFLAYMNPIKLINDGLLSLYYFDHYDLLITNVAIMSTMTIVFGAITYVIVRRVKYASI